MSVSSLIFPYKYSEDALEINIDEIKIDGELIDSSNVIDIDQNTVTLSGLEGEWDKAGITVSVKDPNHQLETYVPDKSLTDSIELYLVVRNKFTRKRSSVELSKNTNGVWLGQFNLLKDELFKSTDVQCFAVLADDIQPEQGYTKRKSERIAASEQWKIYTDILPPMPGGALNSEWRDFSKDEKEELRNRDDCVWYLDLTDPESPRLLLNECVPSLRSALEVSQKTGRPARVRDALIHSILQSVLIELAVFVLGGARDMDLDDLPDWQQKLLTSLARRNDSSTVEVKAEEWIRVWGATNGSDHWLVLRDVTTAVQRHLNLYHSSEHLVKSVERELVDD